MKEMPDLSPTEKAVEQRKALKFWVNHAKRLEDENERLKEELRKYRGH